MDIQENQQEQISEINLCPHCQSIKIEQTQEGRFFCADCFGMTDETGMDKKEQLQHREALELKEEINYLAHLAKYPKKISLFIVIGWIYTAFASVGAIMLIIMMVRVELGWLIFISYLIGAGFSSVLLLTIGYLQKKAHYAHYQIKELFERLEKTEKELDALKNEAEEKKDLQI